MQADQPEPPDAVSHSSPDEPPTTAAGPAATRLEDADALLPAGDFDDWLAAMGESLEGRRASAVPCDDCNACCRAAYFIAIRPEDEAARRRIPAELIFPAPAAPAGHGVLPHTEAGACPMFTAAGCSIYQDRPFTCQQYDCRVFAATETADSDPRRAGVMDRVRRWRFDFASEDARQRQQILAAGAAFLRREGERLAVTLPSDVTQLALLAVRLFPVFEALQAKLKGADAATREAVADAVRKIYGL
ncbi:MAG: YkgJ family cysteine cluster protein [Pseudomonadota bacterium]